MKKIILAFLIISSYFEALHSQNFAPTGSKWQYEFSAVGGVNGTITYEALNDTSLFGMTCRRVVYKQRCNGPNAAICRNYTKDDLLYFHQRNDSLFQVYGNGYVNLLFNFKANVGDSLAIVEDLLGSGDNKFAVVTRKSDTLLGGRTMKVWEMSKRCNRAFPIEVQTFKVYEHIYRLSDGLFIWGRCGGFIEFKANLCAYQSGNWRVEQFSCTATAVNQLDNTAAVSVFPNPSTGKFTVNSSVALSKYAIYNTAGQVLKQAAFLQSNEIDISPLSNGLYLLQLVDNEGFSVYKKIMKQ